MMRLLTPLLLLPLLTACLHAAPIPDAEELARHLELIWEAPEPLRDGHALLMPDRSPIDLELAIREEQVERHPPLEVEEWRDEVDWELISGDGRLAPRAGGFRCRFVPMRVTADEPIVIRATLTRHYVHERGLFQRDQTIAVTVDTEARIIAPVSAVNLDATGEIQGFPIGVYPSPHDPDLLRELGPGYDWVTTHALRFEPPLWFYPVTRESLDWKISDHLRLGSFVLYRPWFRDVGLPQWVALDPMLITKMEELAQILNAHGIDFDEYTLIYGFRSPAYNLGRRDRDGDESLKSPFSQHMYGRAADFIIDTDGDMVMDDLNGDGEHDIFDAAVIMHHINQLDRRYRAAGDPRVGGAGLYDHHDFFERPEQSPYAHIDVRGFLRENGQLYRWLEVWPQNRDIRVRWGAESVQDLIWREPTPVSPEEEAPAGPIDPMLAVQQGREGPREEPAELQLPPTAPDDNRQWRMINPYRD